MNILIDKNKVFEIKLLGFSVMDSNDNYIGKTKNINKRF